MCDAFLHSCHRGCLSVCVCLSVRLLILILVLVLIFTGRRLLELRFASAIFLNTFFAVSLGCIVATTTFRAFYFGEHNLLASW